MYVHTHTHAHTHIHTHITCEQEILVASRVRGLEVYYYTQANAWPAQVALDIQHCWYWITDRALSNISQLVVS